MQLKYSSINYNHKNYIVKVPSLPNEQGQIIFIYSVNEVEKSFITLTYNVFFISSDFNYRDVNRPHQISLENILEF
jgi:hypothetical protein